MSPAARLIVVGGGIAGLAVALATGRRGHAVSVLEQADAFGEVGAGIQLGPNATRRLRVLGLGDEVIGRIAARPGALVVRSAERHLELARMRLGPAFAERYGAPYLCVHRADLHAALHAAVQRSGTASLVTDARITGVVCRGDDASALTADSRGWRADGLVGADGLWSTVRPSVLGDASPARPTGHMAWRGLVEQASLPLSHRSGDVTVWLGARLHVVAYPVRAGEFLNVVVLAEGAPSGDARDWSQATSLQALRAATGRTCSYLQDLFEAMPSWGAWTLHARAPLVRPSQLALKRMALVGDAAHPMLPYLAQGAGMAIEDADTLAESLDGCDAARLPAAFTRYAALRWQRNARVQARAARNGEIFHAVGLQRMARDAALRLLGERLLDVPWLYGR